MTALDDINALVFSCDEKERRLVMRQFDTLLQQAISEVYCTQGRFEIQYSTEPTKAIWEAFWVQAGNTLPVPDNTELVWRSSVSGQYLGTYVVIKSVPVRLESRWHQHSDVTRYVIKEILVPTPFTFTGSKSLRAFRNYDANYYFSTPSGNYSDKITITINSPVDVRGTFNFPFGLYASSITSSPQDVFFHYTIDGVIQEETYPTGTSYDQGLFPTDTASGENGCVYWPIAETFLANTEYVITFGFTQDNTGIDTAFTDLSIQDSNPYYIEFRSV